MHPLLDTLLKLTHMKREEPGPQLTREQALSAYPIRNPSLQWEMNENDEAVVQIPRRNDMTGRFLGWMFFVPESRPVVLDDVGTFVWENCDGTRTVAEIVQLMADQFQVSNREIELSLTEYLKTLGKRGMVGLLVDREIAQRLGLKGKQIIGFNEAENAAAMGEKQSEAEAETDAGNDAAEGKTAQ